MNWTNWIYLGIGIGLGVGIRWLFPKSKASKTESSLFAGATDNPTTLREEMKQTLLAYEMAHEISQFKAGFLARTTHELRSPLNGLISLHQLILSDLCEDPAEEREFISAAHDSALKLVKLIDEILNVARTEHGTNKLDIQPRSLAETLQEVHKLTYMLAANRNYPFYLLLPESSLYVLADPRWLRQVLLNLVDTAIAGMEEGSISISSSSSDEFNLVYIWLDVPNHAIDLKEAVDLLKSAPYPTKTNKSQSVVSPGMRLLLNQAVLEVMGGKLEIVPYPATKESPEDMIRVQVSIPLVILETGFPAELEVN